MLNRQEPVDDRKFRLADLCADVLMLTLHLRATEPLGGMEDLRSRIVHLLRRLQKECLRNGFSQNAVDDVHFALVAFLDETIIGSDWQGKQAWQTNPLQSELFSTLDAGKLFYDKLETLHNNPFKNKEILEVYYLCLVLGFKGAYQNEPQKRRDMIEDLYAIIGKDYQGLWNRMAPFAFPAESKTAPRSSGISIPVIALGVMVLIFIISYAICTIRLNGLVQQITGLVK